MEHDEYLALQALKSRGGICREGDLCDRFLLEVRGKRLHISVRGRLDFSAAGTLLPWRERHYDLEEAEAARLLACLREDYGEADLPERIIMREFEFSAPANPLREYLDDRKIAYEHTTDELLV